jgi:metal-sulfur cluster biosynthetic enzyme
VTDANVIDQVREALRQVYDPELGLDIVALGLVYGISIEDGRLVIEMTLTTPGCPVSENLPQQAVEAASTAVAAFGVPADVRVVWDPPWTPERMEESAADTLGLGSRRR